MFVPPRLLFLRGIDWRNIKTPEEVVEDYYTREIGSDREDFFSAPTQIVFGKLPKKYTDYDSYNVENIRCLYSGILLNGKYPFIPTYVKTINGNTHDGLNRLNVADLIANPKTMKTVKIQEQSRVPIVVEKGVFGAFLNFSVALRYIEDSNWSDSEKFERTRYLQKLHQEWMEQSPIWEGYGKTVPDSFRLEHYGGDMSSDEFKSITMWEFTHFIRANSEKSLDFSWKKLILWLF